MQILVFTYFLLLLLYVWKRNKCFSIGCYIILLYTFSAFFSILIDAFDLYGQGGVYPKVANNSFIATFLYCFLLTICIYPFCKIKNNQIEYITLRNHLLFKIICYFFFFIFLLSLFFLGKNTINILTGDIGTFRIKHYMGTLDSYQTNLDGISFVLSFILNIFSYLSPLALIFFFYSITFLNNSRRFNMMIFLSSFSQLIIAVQTADRANFIYYISMLGFCYFLFSHFFSKKQRKFVHRFIFIFGITFIIYIVLITTARFSARSGGTWGSVIQYAGQSYPNFCYLYENFEAPNISTLRLFPMTNHFIFDADYGMERRNYLLKETGITTSVFSTFLGTIMVDLGKKGMIIYAIIFSVFMNFLVKRQKRRSEIDFSWLILLFIFVSIPIFGIFYYRYYNYNASFFVVCSIFLYALFKFPLLKKQLS